MHYLIYKTINLINGKYYIGKHQTQDLDDGYQGSGRLLGRAIKKYGRQNFVTHIIGNYEHEKHMNIAEKILVVPDIETNYNLCPGGQGGFGYIRKNLPNGMLGKKQTEYQKHQVQKANERDRENVLRRLQMNKVDFEKGNQIWLGRKHSEETKKKMSIIKKGLIPWNKGLPRSDETKRKISETLSRRIS